MTYQNFMTRRSERLPTSIAPTVREKDGRTIAIEVLDLTEFGLRARADGSIAYGNYVCFVLPGVGETIARVVWSRMYEFGAEFITLTRVEDVTVALACDQLHACRGHRPPAV